MSPDRFLDCHDPPVARTEYLLRHFPNHPGEYNSEKKFIRASVFCPRKSDEHGISLYREGEPYTSAATLLASLKNDDVRNFGGVCALLAAGVIDLGLTIVTTLGDLPGHVEIKEINRIDYDKDKRRIKDIQDKLIRLVDMGPEFLQIRMHPKERPDGK